MEGVGCIELVWEQQTVTESGAPHDSRYHVIRLSTLETVKEGYGPSTTHLRVETLVDDKTVDIVEVPVETSWPVTTVQTVEFFIRQTGTGLPRSLQ